MLYNCKKIRKSMRKLTVRYNCRPVNRKGETLQQFENMKIYNYKALYGVVREHDWMTKLALPIQILLISKRLKNYP